MMAELAQDDTSQKLIQKNTSKGTPISISTVVAYYILFLSFLPAPLFFLNILDRYLPFIYPIYLMSPFILLIIIFITMLFNKLTNREFGIIVEKKQVPHSRTEKIFLLSIVVILVGLLGTLCSGNHFLAHIFS